MLVVVSLQMLMLPLTTKIQAARIQIRRTIITLNLHLRIRYQSETPPLLRPDAAAKQVVEVTMIQLSLVPFITYPTPIIRRCHRGMTLWTSCTPPYSTSVEPMLQLTQIMEGPPSTHFNAPH